MLPFILDGYIYIYMCVFMLYTPRERDALLRFACQRRVSAGACAILNTSERGTVFASEYYNNVRGDNIH